jgi:hypothetical protein
VLGSGIAALQRSPDDIGSRCSRTPRPPRLAFAITLIFGLVSGGHFNPVASVVDAHSRGLSWRDTLTPDPARVPAASPARSTPRPCRPDRDQHLRHHRASGAHFFAEVIATLGLLLVIFSLARTSRATRPSRSRRPTSPPPTGSELQAASSTRLSRRRDVSLPHVRRRPCVRSGFVRDNIHCRTPTALMKICATAGSVRL